MVRDTTEDFPDSGQANDLNSVFPKLFRPQTSLPGIPFARPSSVRRRQFALLLRQRTSHLSHRSITTGARAGPGLNPVVPSLNVHVAILSVLSAQGASSVTKRIGPDCLIAHYVEPISVSESELERVTGLLGLKDVEQRDRARSRIYSALEDLQTARVHDVRPKPSRDDLRDLADLASIFDMTSFSASLQRGIETLETLRTKNPVLYQRLSRLFRRPSLYDQLHDLERIEEAAFAISRTIHDNVDQLSREIEVEDRRGRPADFAARHFAEQMRRVWVEFTGRGTSRQGAYGREKEPFGDFVDAAGKLIDSDFKGHYLAREVHDASRDSASGE